MWKQVGWILLLSVGVGVATFAWVRGNLAKGACIEYSETIDLGQIEHRQRIEASFLLKNTGSELLQLSDFRAGCGCVHLYKKEESGMVIIADETLPPNSEVQIWAQFNAANMHPGKFSQRIDFKTNDPRRVVCSLHIIGDLHHGVYSIPKELVGGRLAIGQESLMEFKLVDSRQPEKRSALTLTSSSNQLIIKSMEEYQESDPLAGDLGDAKTYKVRIALAPTAEGPNYHELLNVLDAEGDGLCSVSVNGVVSQEITLSPSLVMFMPDSKAKSGTRVRKCIVQSDSGTLGLRVSSCPPELKVDIRDGNVPSQKLLEICCVAPAPSDLKKLVIVLDAKRNAENEVTLTLPVVMSGIRTGE
jgi:hypothetical protein